MGNLFFGFEGRIGRGRWWLGSVLMGILVAVLFVGVFAMLLGGSNPSKGLPFIILMLPVYYIAIALAVKRLKDRDRPLWFVALFYAPAK